MRRVALALPLRAGASGGASGGTSGSGTGTVTVQCGGFAVFDSVCFIALTDGRVLRYSLRNEHETARGLEVFAESPVILRGNCLAIDSEKRLHFHSDRYTFVAPIESGYDRVSERDCERDCERDGPTR